MSSHHSRGRLCRIDWALALSALAAAIVGCKAVGPDYAAPDPKKESPPEFKQPQSPESISAGITVEPVKPDWWTAFNDPKLDSLVKRAVESNLDLKTADSRVREARAQRGIAAADLGPQVNVGGRAGLGGDYDSRAQGSWSVGFDATWEIDVFGGIRRSIESAEANIQMSQEARHDTLVSLLGEVGRNYVELRGLQRQLDIARKNVETQAGTLKLVEVQRKNQLASDLEVSQASSTLESTKATVPRLEASVVKAVARLSVLVGLEPNALAAELAEPAPIPADPPKVPVGLPSDLLIRRPDIRKAERNMAASTANLGVAKADLYPKFALTANVDLKGFYAGPAVSWPIFTSGAIANNIKAVDERLEQATLQYKQTVLLALEDVETSLNAYAKELVRRQNLTKAAADAENAYKKSDAQYRAGLKDFLYVLDSQRTLYAAQSELAQCEQAAMTYLVAVYKALGGGWELFPEKPKAEKPAGS